MTSPRRIAGPDAKNRSVLLDAAEQIMLEDGYAAVTSRRVASRAGLKPQLVHYYFRTMDDLFLAAFRRRAEEGLERQAQALAGPHPLRAMWEFSTEADAVALTMEFAALGNHRKAILAEIAHYAEKFRAAEIQTITRLAERYPLNADPASPAALAVIMASVARMVVMEQSLGMSGGHSEILALVESQLDRLEPLDPVPAAAGNGAHPSRSAPARRAPRAR
jgi:AcrR family transcriptional regulator